MMWQTAGHRLRWEGIEGHERRPERSNPYPASHREADASERDAGLWGFTGLVSGEVDGSSDSRQVDQYTPHCWHTKKCIRRLLRMRCQSLTCLHRPSGNNGNFPSGRPPRNPLPSDSVSQATEGVAGAAVPGSSKDERADKAMELSREIAAVASDSLASSSVMP